MFKSIKSLLFVCFGLPLIAISLSLIFITSELDSTLFYSERLYSLRKPTTEASQSLEKYVHQVLASLRGWLILEDNRFKVENEEAWLNIDLTLEQMGALSKRWTNPENNKRLAQLVPLMSSFKSYQVDIFKTLNTDRSRSIQLLEEKAVPISKKILFIVEDMAEDQKKLHLIDATEIKDSIKKEKTTATVLVIANVFLFVGLLLFVFRNVTHPILRAVSFANQVSRNDLETPILIRGPKEIEDLGRSMEEMRTSLKRHQRDLQSKNDELLQFSYRTSHDLKSPLTTIKGLSHYILKDLDSGDLDEVRQNASEIRTQSLRLEDLIVKLLEFAKSDIGPQNESRIEIENLVTNVENETKGYFDHNKVSLHKEISITRTHLSSNIKLYQILTNIVGNAAKYADANKPNRFVKLKVYDDRDNLYFEIEDNGVGIPAENKDDVYLMFKKFHSDNRLGSGLGMYMVKKSVEFLNGSIDYTSSKNGTKFNVRIPTKEA